MSQPKTPIDLMHAIRYQLPMHQATYSECEVTGCTNGARGGRRCLECLVTFSQNPAASRAFADAIKAENVAAELLIGSLK